MRIIKEGRLPEEEVWQGECHNCHTVFEAKRGELTRSPGEYNSVDYTNLCTILGCGRTVYFTKTSRYIPTSMDISQH